MTEFVDTFMTRKVPRIDSSWKISATNKFDKKRRQKTSIKEITDSVVTAFQDHTKLEVLKIFRMDGRHRWDDVKIMASEAEKTRWRKNPLGPQDDHFSEAHPTRRFS
ncbi:hypothetical protein CCHR01_05841 [Colletotrichum chrysophilum]|uniref:Uncharacterized protein n=1 Tax=Colletotrichum chrysophilum TaxID=1836956 RepID=A0AAD9AQ75_9PEZI|nr:hypothetical protein CCHR01_05841 [Colletotrichum chrysophilum]